MAATLKQLGGLLGILQDDPDAWLKGDQVITPAGHLTFTGYAPSVVTGVSKENIEQQIQARLDAKKAKNWALADQIRDELKGQGVILEDAPDGTTSWRRE